MSAKSIIAVIFVAILIGVLYVVFEKNFSGTDSLSNAQTTSKSETSKKAVEQAQVESSLIKLPTADATPKPITSSTDLQKEAESLEMRDYSSYFEELKQKAQE